MPKVSVMVELQVEVEPGNPVDIERAIDAEGKRASRELYVEIVQRLDAETSAASGAARQRLEPRYIATVFGRVRIHRWRVKKRGEDSFHPLDRLLNLRQSEPSAALRETICEIACRIPYRQVADVSERITGESMSHLLCWRVVQDEGGRLIDEEGRNVEMIFGNSPKPPHEHPSSPEVVIVEADGTFLRAQGKDRTQEQTRFEVRTGVFYTGKERAGGGKHKRWRLVGMGSTRHVQQPRRLRQSPGHQGF